MNVGTAPLRGPSLRGSYEDGFCGKPGLPLMGRTVRSRLSAGRRPPSLPRRSFYSEDGSPRPSAGWGRSSIGSGQGTPCSGPRGGWWSFTSGTKKSSKLELKGKVGRLEGGASREGVEGPALPCCRVRGTWRGSGMKSYENMNFYKSQSRDETSCK